MGLEMEIEDKCPICGNRFKRPRRVYENLVQKPEQCPQCRY